MYKIIPVPPFDIILFGATGDLARREILPALFRGFSVRQVPEDFRLAGVARAEMSDDEFRALCRDSIRSAQEPQAGEQEVLEKFLRKLSYFPLDATGGAGWDRLAAWPRPDKILTFYLSVGPSVFEQIIDNLKHNNMVRPDCRIVVEKPFGQDLPSSQALNGILAGSFNESQIFRIDHYLGKETVQNLMALRFANVLFEPLWNWQHVEHVQITVSESIGVKGRQGYYDAAGGMRDMVQNHLMQLLCLVAMEPPARFEADAVRDEKLKVIKALRDMSSRDIVRGQYGAAAGMASYLEDSETTYSETESFIALKCRIGNMRWGQTPFYLRTGKRLKARMSEVAVVFKRLPHSIFGLRDQRRNNILAVRLQPDEGITLQVTIKEPGPGGMRLIEVPLDMSFAESLGPEIGTMTNAYERLIMDVIRGNQTLFMRNDEIEAAWRWTDQVIACWSEEGSRPEIYAAGSEGPSAAAALMDYGRQWRVIE
ncbi:MAG: glucose-6-phosphate dehydrogenase [Rhodobacteraceae bacterium]|nr:glucose-6-phosphate dehydrogenase [Paracoccaceae bacterium]